MTPPNPNQDSSLNYSITQCRNKEDIKCPFSQTSHVCTSVDIYSVKGHYNLAIDRLRIFFLFCLRPLALTGSVSQS